MEKSENLPFQKYFQRLKRYLFHGEKTRFYGRSRSVGFFYDALKTPLFQVEPPRGVIIIIINKLINN